MKKLLFLSLALISFMGAKAQSITLLGFGGYTFQQTIRYPNADIKIGDGFQYGGGLEVGIGENRAIELIYQRYDPQLRAIYYGPLAPPPDYVEAGVNYIMAGGTNYFPLNDVLSGFGTIDLGVMFANPKDKPELDGMTRFAWGIRGGLRIKPTDVISLRLYGQLLSPVQAFGGSVWFGSGGASAGVSTYSTIYQFNVGGMLGIKLK